LASGWSSDRVFGGQGFLVEPPAWQTINEGGQQRRKNIVISISVAISLHLLKLFILN